MEEPAARLMRLDPDDVASFLRLLLPNQAEQKVEFNAITISIISTIHPTFPFFIFFSVNWKKVLLLYFIIIWKKERKRMESGGVELKLKLLHDFCCFIGVSFVEGISDSERRLDWVRGLGRRKGEK